MSDENINTDQLDSHESFSETSSQTNRISEAQPSTEQNSLPQSSSTQECVAQTAFRANTTSYTQQQCQPPYYPEPPKPRKIVWPWVVLGICIGFILATLIFLSYGAFFSNDSQGASQTTDSMGSVSESGSADSFTDESLSDSAYSGYSYDELKEYAQDLPGTSSLDVYSAGLYLVGKDCDPGTYYFSGSQIEEGNFYTFSYNESTDSYDMNLGIIYFGNYYADLSDGDAILFYGYGETFEGSMQLASKVDTVQDAPPYNSGCYLVGRDIPAGTYAITAQEGYTTISASDEPAAYVMNDLDFNDDSIVDTKYVITGSNQRVTVSEGQYLELYLSVASPVD